MSTDEEVRIGCFVKRLMIHFFLYLLIRFVIEKPDSVTCTGFDGKLQNFESRRDLRPVQCYPFLFESNARKIINTQVKFTDYFF